MKFSSVTNQVKAAEQFFPVVLFIMLYKLPQMKAFTEQHFSLFPVLG